MDFGFFWEGEGVADVGTILIVRNVRACLMIGSFSSGGVGMLRLVRRNIPTAPLVLMLVCVLGISRER